MSKTTNGEGPVPTRPLGLRRGDLVEVRSAEEILATLDDSGAIDALPCMPELLEYAGQRFRVEARADKTCDTINYSGSRRLFDTVHLEGIRCSGKAHGGCEAQCSVFWKETWLKRADGEDPRASRSSDPAGAGSGRDGRALPLPGNRSAAGLDADSLVGSASVLARRLDGQRAVS